MGNQLDGMATLGCGVERLCPKLSFRVAALPLPPLINLLDIMQRTTNDHGTATERFRNSDDPVVNAEWNRLSLKVSFVITPVLTCITAVRIEPFFLSIHTTHTDCDHYYGRSGR